MGDLPRGFAERLGDTIKAMGKQMLSPDQVVLDLVLPYSESPGKNAACLTARNVFVVVAQNHRGQFAQVMIKFHLGGEPEDGPPPRFVLWKLGPTVWKLSPSITAPGMLHAYLTIVKVPDPAPWEK